MRETPALADTVSHESPLATKWKLSHFVVIPVWIGVGVVTPSPVVVEVVFVLDVLVVDVVLLDVLVINVLDDVDDDFVVVVVVTEVEEATEEEEVLDDGGFWFKVDSGTKLICTQ